MRAIKNYTIIILCLNLLCPLILLGDSNFKNNSPVKKIIRANRDYQNENKKGISLLEIPYLGLTGYVSYKIMETGYVVLGRDVALLGLSRFVYKNFVKHRIVKLFDNNLDKIDVYIMYYPMGSDQLSSKIFAGEMGKMVMSIENISNKNIKNIKPILELKSIASRGVEPELKIDNKKTKGGKRSLKGSYSLGPKESMELVFYLTIPGIYDAKNLSFNGGINSNTESFNYRLQESLDPPSLNLVINDFIDDDGNGSLDAYESARITGYVENQGDGVGRGVKVELTKTPKTIAILDNITSLGDILPGRRENFTFLLKGKKNTINQNEELVFYVSDIKGNDARPISSLIPTKKFLPPKLEITNWSINDGNIGLADGNGNNLIENGESVEILFELKNIGEGPAYGVSTDVTVAGLGVLPINGSEFIGAIGPSAMKSIPIGFRVPVTYKKESFKFSVTITDERKIINFVKPITVDCAYRTPKLSFDYVIHDGTTAGSRGNQNGLIEQGEKIELEILARNDGDLDAEDVTLNLDAKHNGIEIKSLSRYSGMQELTIGKIPARQIARKQMIPIDVRWNADVGPFDLKVLLGMANFSGIRQTIPLEIYKAAATQVAMGVSSSSGFGTNVTSDDEWINVDIAPNTNNKLKNGFAVVIGNRNYENRDIPQVDYADRDSRVFKSYLTKTIGIPTSNIIELTDAKLSDFNRIFGTRENKEGQLFKQVKRIGDNAKVYVFYSGHGAPDLNTNEAYIVPAGASMGNIEFEGYPLEVLIENLGSLPVKSNQVTLVMDACFSGKSESGMLYKKISPALLKVKAPSMSGLNVFSSSRNDQVSSWYPKARHGVFTYYVLAGLQGQADQNQDKKITNGEMEVYLSDKVPSKVNELSNFTREQNPTFSGDKAGVILKY